MKKQKLTALERQQRFWGVVLLLPLLSCSNRDLI